MNLIPTTGSFRPFGRIIAGLSNAYAGYVATKEEYQAQDYEGLAYSQITIEWTIPDTGATGPLSHSP